jgi:retinol-binding protein 3
MDRATRRLASVARAALARAGMLLVPALLLLASLAGACRAQAPAPELDRSAQREVIDRVGAVLRERYVFPEVAERIAASLREAEHLGEFVSLREPEAFANALTARMREIGRDRHLWIAVDRGEYPEPERAPAPGAAEAQRRALARSNFGLTRTEVLPGNVGYLNIRQFVAPELAGDAADGVT